MSVFLEPMIARIFSDSGHISGAGLLLPSGNVLTCAHVVLNSPNQRSEKEQDSYVTLDFPFVPDKPKIQGIIIHIDEVSDVAVLSIGDHKHNIQQHYVSIPLVRVDELWRDAFRVFGFPKGYDQGIWVTGVFRGRQTSGWEQLESDQLTGYRIEQGFSGTPVWDEQLDAVVGVVIATDKNPSARTAYMISADEILRISPQLKNDTIAADSLQYLQLQIRMYESAQAKSDNPLRFRAKIQFLRDRIKQLNLRNTPQQNIYSGALSETDILLNPHNLSVSSDSSHIVTSGQKPQNVTSYFRDREEEINLIQQLLFEADARLISIIGVGGMGKTALTCKILQDLEITQKLGKSPTVNGIAYLSATTDGISLEQIFLECAKILPDERGEIIGNTWRDPKLNVREKLRILFSQLEEGFYVLLLDNLESRLDDLGRLVDKGLEQFLEASLRTPSSVKIIVTSRISLFFKHDSLRFIRQINLFDGLPLEEGVELLRDLDSDGERGLKTASRDQLAKIVTLVHGVPRALEIVNGILANNPFLSLDELYNTFYQQEDVARSLIEENYRRLNHESRQVIDALAILHSPVPVAAIAYLLKFYSPSLDIRSVVNLLNKANIVNIDRETQNVILHPVDQDFAYSQIPDVTESEYNRKLLEARAADYYAEIRKPQQEWKTIEDLKPQLYEFNHRIRAGDYDAACSLLETIDYGYLHLWGYFPRLAEMWESLSDYLTDSKLRALCLASTGRAYRSMGQIKMAIARYEEALSIAGELGDKKQQGDILGSLGLTYRAIGKVKEAISCHQEALEMFSNESDQRKAFQLGSLASAYVDLGQFDMALQFCQQALQVAETQGDLRSKGINLGQLGTIHHYLGNITQAIEYHEQSLEVAYNIHDRRGEGIQLNKLGSVYKTIKEYEKSHSLYLDALKITRDIGDMRAGAYCLLGLGKVQYFLGDIPSAKQYYEEAYQLDMPDTNYLTSLAFAMLSLKERDGKALDYFDRSVYLCRELLAKTEQLYLPTLTLGTALLGQAVCQLEATNLIEAESLIKKAQEQYDRAINTFVAKGLIQDALQECTSLPHVGHPDFDETIEALRKALND